MKKKQLFSHKKKFGKIKILISIIFILSSVIIKPTMANIRYVPAFEGNTDNYSKINDTNSNIEQLESPKLGELEVTPIDYEYKELETVPNDNLAEIPSEDTEINQNKTERVIDANKPMVALTFDDGPDNVVTNIILDTLKEYNSKATFFILGNRIDSNREALTRIISDEHELGNHTFNHVNLTKNKQSVIENEVFGVDNLILEYYGFAPKLLRTPGGSINNNVLNSFDKSIIMWNVDPQDWKYRNKDHIVSAVVNNIQDGDIVLLHDIYKSTGEAALEIIPILIEKGFQLVTVSELSDHRSGLEINQQYRSFRK